MGNNGDNCQAVGKADQADLDNDGVGDACDPDIDDDGVANGSNAFPANPDEWTDSDSDGIGDNADAYDNSNTGPAPGGSTARLSPARLERSSSY